MSIIFNLIRFVNEFSKRVLPVNRSKIVFTSFPDLSDNSWALFEYYYEHSTNMELVWLVETLEISLTRKLERYSNVKMYKRKSFVGWFNYITARLVFHTHGVYGFNKLVPDDKQRIIVNLWHGMPIKQVGMLDSKHAGKSEINERKSHYSLATSEFYMDIVSASFAIPKEDVLNFGLPRADALMTGLSVENRYSIFKKMSVSKNSRLIVWLPTYRRSMIGDIRADSEFGSFIDEVGVGFLRELDSVSILNDLSVIIKLHPMDVLNIELDTVNLDFKRISIIDASTWLKAHIDLYDLLAASELLITDLSSVLIDVLPSSVRVATTTCDFSHYKRDLIPNVYGLWSEIPKIKNADDVLEILSNDKLISHKTLECFNVQTEGNSCERIFKFFEKA